VSDVAGGVATAWQVVVALAVVIGAAQALAGLVHRAGQPAVMGEVIAGILLGPSLLGAVAPEMSGGLFPPHVLSVLAVHAEIGVVLYMFLVGAELSADTFAARGRAAVAVALAGILVPFTLGVVLGAALAPHFAPADVPLPIFASFIGLSLSVTALAVLARMLRDLRLTASPIGTLALASAALSDATVLGLLAVLAGFARARGGEGLETGLTAIAYVAVMVFVVGPVSARLARSGVAARSRRAVAAIVVAGLAVSAWTADRIGVEGLLGGFLFGAVLPRAAHLPAGVTRGLERIVSIGFLPAFFAMTGLRTEIGLLADAGAWSICGAIIVIAAAGKIGGTWLAARFTGLPAREALALGVLMNTRGLVEIVVLNVGLDLGILTPQLFTTLVVMALVTTFATPPAWTLVVGRR
jgi:Kef-type K+ transport system membrane component KefB